MGIVDHIILNISAVYCSLIHLVKGFFGGWASAIDLSSLGTECERLCSERCVNDGSTDVVLGLVLSDYRGVVSHSSEWCIGSVQGNLLILINELY
jgi:hypothetical protein